jgi:geranylgeranyl diphosphate synthase type II
MRAYVELINRALDRYSRFPPGCPDRLGEAIRYSLLAPGKRFRPLLVLFAAEACGCGAERALPAAAAVEMIHAYSLIHDDLPAMDDDDLRRGRPSCHTAFGEATAILAGDALLTRAFETLATEIQPSETAVRCCAELASAAGASQLVGGQADDLDPDLHRPALEDLEYIHQRKTGALLVASVRLGATVAGAGAEVVKSLTRFGSRLGIAFQIVDDLLDWQGDAHVVGQRAAKDPHRGRWTYPDLLGVDESRQRARQLVSAACDELAGLGAASHNLRELAWFAGNRDQ